MGFQADKIFVNLAVKDLNKSKAFFSKLGFEFNAQFTNELAASMIINDNIFAMLLVEEHFKTFTKKKSPILQQVTKQYWHYLLIVKKKSLRL